MSHDRRALGILGIIAAFLVSSMTSGQTCTPDWVQMRYTGFNGAVRALTVWDPDGTGPEPEWLVCGGEFTDVNGLTANHIAAWDGLAWHTFGQGFSPGNSTVSVYALTSHNGKLYAGGSFTGSGGSGLPYLAVWNGAAWKSVGPAPSNIVAGLASFGGDLYACGEFTRFGGDTVRNVGRWNGVMWSALGVGLYRFLGEHCNGLYLDGARLVVSGCFDTAGNLPSADIAAWDGAQWSALGVGINNGYCGVANSVRHGGLLYATGEFLSAGNLPAARIAAWNGTAWSALGTGLGGVGTKSGFTLASFSTDLYVGGAFTTAGPITSPGLARWDGAGWKGARGGVGFDEGGGVFALLAYQDELIVAGKFNWAGTSPKQNWARWSADGRPTVIRQPSPATLDSGQTLTLSATPGTDYSNVLVQWLRNGAPISDGPGGASPGGGTVSGATAALSSPTNGSPAILTISDCKRGDSGQYSVEFLNGCGGRESRAATVVIGGLCPADFNGDGFVTGDDFDAYVAAFAPGDPAADFNHDGFVTGDDFDAYVQAFEAGC